MKKKVLAILMTGLLAITTVSCGTSGDDKATDSGGNSEIQSTQEESGDSAVVTDASLTVIKEGHFSEWPGKTIGEAFDSFFENGSWSAASDAVLFTGDYKDTEGSKTVGIRYKPDSASGLLCFDGISVDGEMKKDRSNEVDAIYYPQLMRAVFQGAEIPVIKQTPEGDYDSLLGMWVGVPYGQAPYLSSEVIHIKNVNGDVLEYETAYCGCNGAIDSEWKIGRTTDGTVGITDSDVSGIKSFQADGENVYIDGDLFYGNYGSDHMRLYRTSFTSFEEVIMYFRGNYEYETMEYTKNDVGFIIAEPIRTYDREFAEVIPSEYDVVEPEWYKQINCFELDDEESKEMGYKYQVVFGEMDNGLLALTYRVVSDEQNEMEETSSNGEGAGIIYYAGDPAALEISADDTTTYTAVKR